MCQTRFFQQNTPVIEALTLSKKSLADLRQAILLGDDCGPISTETYASATTSSLTLASTSSIHIINFNVHNEDRNHINVNQSDDDDDFTTSTVRSTRPVRPRTHRRVSSSTPTLAKRGRHPRKRQKFNDMHMLMTTAIPVWPNSFIDNIRCRLRALSLRGGTHVVYNMSMDLDGWCPQLFEFVFSPFQSTTATGTLPFTIRGVNLKPSLSLRQVQEGHRGVYLKIYTCDIMSNPEVLNDFCHFQSLSPTSRDRGYGVRLDNNDDSDIRRSEWKLCVRLICTCRVDFSRPTQNQIRCKVYVTSAVFQHRESSASNVIWHNDFKLEDANNIIEQRICAAGDALLQPTYNVNHNSQQQLHRRISAGPMEPSQAVPSWRTQPPPLVTSFESSDSAEQFDSPDRCADHPRACRHSDSQNESDSTEY